MNAKLLLLDAHLPPSICPWVEDQFRIRCQHVRDAGLQNSDDGSIIEYAHRAEAAILTKDGDLAARVEVDGPPPWTILLTCGNATNERLRRILSSSLGEALGLLTPDTPAVIMTDA